MGRDKRNGARAEHFAAMIRNTMSTPAWRALSPSAQALYPWLKLEWRGPKANNNGRIVLSVRQAAGLMGCGINTAARAFHDLQAKGFLVVKRHAQLGVKGQATAPEFELTEIAMPGEGTRPRKLFADWKEGGDYPVQKAAIHNPRGTNRKQNPVIELATARHRNSDG
ncbi:helix-turn-helix domain-containing protein [Paracoccus salsus]|uniref:helix-turn-helix domain-containing protein n=1 Tax=Paracoccus salsus TaxID=2911061 RepID=UPI001F306016|nr:helix-turn-helix domain-containing protein [Paracoccus salsus]MCF3974000.1 helix-turn-helix domain-containing protein [Paracoccus salsus]